MNITCYYDFPIGDWNNNYYFDTIYNALKNHHTNYNWTYVDSSKIFERRSEPCMKFAHPHMIIENTDTKKYFLKMLWNTYISVPNLSYIILLLKTLNTYFYA